MDELHELASDTLAHHGIKGQKWGIRRYQNEDGSWTPSGRERYSTGDGEKRGEYKDIGDKKTFSKSNSRKLSKGAKAAIIATGAVGGLAIAAISVRALNERRYAVTDALSKVPEQRVNMLEQARSVRESMEAEFRKEAENVDYYEQDEKFRDHVDRIRSNKLMSDETKNRSVEELRQRAINDSVGNKIREVKNADDIRDIEFVKKAMEDLSKQFPELKNANNTVLFGALMRDAANGKVAGLGAEIVNLGKGSADRAMEVLKKDVLKFR